MMAAISVLRFVCLISFISHMVTGRTVLPKSLDISTSLRELRPFQSFLAFNTRSRARTLTRGSSGFRRDPACAGLEFQTFNGTCNNLFSPEFGSIDSGFELIAERKSFQFENLPNPREISNIVCEEAAPLKNSRGLAEFFTFFGQLLDHTVTEISVDSKKPLPIPIPENDPVFDSKTQEIPFFRTITVQIEADEVPLNGLSSFIDASSIYSVEEEVTEKLRKFVGGLLKTPGGLLITNADGFFISGDERANENPNLTALHLLFTLEHNNIARNIQESNPEMKDEDIFQLARRVLIAEFQAIVFFEFVPALTGEQLGSYTRYNRFIRPEISNTFSTVGFRVGHTLLNSTVTSITADGIVRNRLLRDSFFNPDAFREDTLDGLLRGLLSGFAAEVDAGITGEVRNFLVNEGEPMQLDLAALNIQRGRDHGVPPYNELRKAYGLPPLTRFEQISSDENLQRKLSLAYDDDIEKVDPWVGGISEDRLVGSSLGPLFQRIWVREFERFRDGDRFYFENNVFSNREREDIPQLRSLFSNFGRQSIMRDIILRNSNLKDKEVPSNPFFVIEK